MHLQGLLPRVHEEGHHNGTAAADALCGKDQDDRAELQVDFCGRKGEEGVTHGRPSSPGSGSPWDAQLWQVTGQPCASSETLFCHRPVGSLGLADGASGPLYPAQASSPQKVCLQVIFLGGNEGLDPQGHLDAGRGSMATAWSRHSLALGAWACYPSHSTPSAGGCRRLLSPEVA